MTKKFWKDNRGQMIYAVVVAIMFLSVLSMIAMGLSLQHYHAAVQKQENIANYYIADAAVEMIRIELIKAENANSEAATTEESTTEATTTEAATPEEPIPDEDAEDNSEGVVNEENGVGDNEQQVKLSIIRSAASLCGVRVRDINENGSVLTFTVYNENVAITVSMENNEFTSWEVSYNASND